MSTKNTRWVGLLTAGALSLALTACGGGDETTDPTTPAPTGGTTTEDTGGDQTAEPGTDATTEDAGAEETTADAGAGDAAEGEEIPASDFVAMLKEPGEEKLSTYVMTMDMKAGAESMAMEGAVDLSGDTPQMQVDMDVPGAGTMQMVMAEGRMFMSMPGVTEEGQFIEVPEEQLGDAATALDDVDITSQYDDWERNATKVVFLGEDDVDGTTMRHYEITMDASGLADSAGVTGGDDAAVTSAFGDEFTYEVWLDDENLMRRMVMEIEGMVTEMKADRWGEPVEIEVPSEDQLMSGPTG